MSYATTCTYTLECYLSDAIRDGNTAQAAALRAELSARNDPAERERRATATRSRLARQHTARVIAEFTREHGGAP